ncbi:MAG TPA: helix-turn-helix transcriptional regulator, partial [Tepidisphaeraceae bacterium]|nr:helix-turn-helix transcriptional regulator [Tepidisphaeraceae bacterium]
EQIIPGIRLIQDQIQSAPPNQIHQIIEVWLLSHIDRGPEVHADLLAAVDRIIASAGQYKIESIADQIGIGKRQLERLFRLQVGVGPKEFASLARFNWLIANWHKRRSWCELATNAGYADQAHFIRNFRARTGVTPGEFHL